LLILIVGGYKDGLQPETLADGNWLVILVVEEHVLGATGYSRRLDQVGWSVTCYVCTRPLSKGV
jgi:hypothetical protein